VDVEVPAPFHYVAIVGNEWNGKRAEVRLKHRFIERKKSTTDWANV
jgi:hypothetical protein